MAIATRTAHTPRRVNERGPSALVARLVAHVNRKNWWHVPPRDSDAYRKRGKFLASSFQEAEFWGRPLDEPQRVTIQNPLIGNEDTIEKELFGRRISTEDITMEERWRLDAKMKRVAEMRGYDSIILIGRKAFAKFRLTGQLPRSIELNIFDVEKR